ncbi:unnamed protein product [Adineta steineri]|uniref:Protein translocase subunit SecA n=1 Tax=Adineta steineri TaxID=433720 RepID=A0A819G8E8_9BILA|nr:unnamed protein product [Adineta steineri]CAF3881467.1 unnamed protein product [Adineta steineri]
MIDETDLHKHDTLQNEYKRLAQNYIKNSSSTIAEMIENFQTKNKSYLFGITNLLEENAEKNENNQHWINFNIIKLNGSLLGFIIDSNEYKVDENKFKNFLKTIIKEEIKFIDYNNRDASSASVENIAIAMSQIEIFILLLQNEKQEIEEKFQSLKLFQKTNQAIEFKKLIVEQGLSMRIRTKPTLKKILSPLESVLHSDTEYKLPEKNQLKMLSSILASENFLPRANDDIDLVKEVIRFLAILKDRGEAFNEEIKKNVRKYFIENRNKYQEKIDEFNTKLHENSRDTTVQGCLDLTLRDRLEFLVNMNKLIPEEISLNDIDGFFRLFSEKNQQQRLEMEKNQLKLSKEGSSLEESMRISNAIGDIEEKLDYYARISEISKELDFNDLTIILGDKLTLNSNKEGFSFSQETFQKIFEIGKITENNQVALAVIKIFNYNEAFLSNVEEVEQTLDNILPKINQEDTGIVLMLSKKLNIRNNSSLLKFLYKILIENSHSEERKEAFEILQSSKIESVNLEYISNTIKLEQKCFKNDASIVRDCLEHVRMRYQLTLNCFEELKKYFHVNETIEIIIEILEQEIQDLPKGFIENILEYIKSSAWKKDNQMNKLRMIKSLFKNKQLTLKDIPNIGELIDNFKSYGDEIFDLLFLEYQNGNEIPKDILIKIKTAGKTNQYALNLIKLIEKTHTDIDIFKDPRNSLEVRRTALENIIQAKQNYTSDRVKLLESVIKYDTNLRIDAFKALITVLPDNFSQTTDFNIDLIEIGKCIGDDEKISIEDMTRLIHKDKMNENLAGILPMIINQIINSQVSIDDVNQALELLTEISTIKQNEKNICDQLHYLLSIAFNTTNTKVRENIIRIIQNSINENELNNIHILKDQIDGAQIESCLADELRELAILKTLKLDRNSLKNLKKRVQQGCAISEDQVNILVDTLVNVDEQGQKQSVYSEISEILFEINLRQGLNNADINRISQNLKLLNFVDVIGILTIALSRNIQFSDEIIQNFWEHFSTIDQKLKNYLICATAAVVAQQKPVPIYIYENITDFVTDQAEAIETRIFCAKILSKGLKQISNYSQITSIITSLKEVALVKRNNRNEDLLNKLIFEILENHLESDFLKEYYIQFKSRIVNSNEELKALDNFMFTNEKDVPDRDKFHLLCALNNTLFNRERIDPTIFNQYPANEWRKEILSSDLLAGTFELINLNDGVSEFELIKFRNSIHLINDFILTLNPEIYSIENLLQTLIDKQNLYQIPLQMINDILLMLFESNVTEALDIVKQEQQTFFTQLRQLWLETRLEHFAIEFTNEELGEFNMYLPYRIEIINFVFSQIHENTKIDQLISFFSKLFQCGLTTESREFFLTKETTKKISLNTLTFRLNDRLVCVLLSNKYSNYAQYFRDSENYKLGTNVPSFVKNAYNQADTTYWYTGEDIAQISSELMKEFDLRITQALCQQVDRDLSTILIEILNEYKQDLKTTIIPLNIAGNHWVTVAIFCNRNKQQHVVLYKDSLGEQHLVEERERVEKIFTGQLENIQFKFHRSCEQSDSYNCGVFTLANMHYIAENLSNKNQQSFIDNFHTSNFTTQKQADQYRREKFPKMYALSLFQSFKRRINENKEIDLNSKELLIKISEDEVETLLDQLCVEVNESNKQILCTNLGLSNKQFIKTDKPIDIKEYEIVKKLHRKLTKVLHSGWALKSIKQIIDHIDSAKKIQSLFDALDPIYEYGLKEFDNNIKGKSLIEILTLSSSSSLLSSLSSWFLSDSLAKQVHDLAVFQIFGGTYDKTFQQLKDDLLDRNRNQNISFLQDKKLSEEYQKVQTAYENKSSICSDFGLIEEWSTSDIKTWSEKIKGLTSNCVSQYEKIAVVKRAVEITSKFPPREIQLLSVLIMLNSEKDKGRLAQINTGEGKTTIVAMLAAIKALEGHQVDIVTSSPELATPQAIQQKEFYQQFNLTVSHNGHDLIDIKKRYNADIVYGAAGNFQGDILRDEYSKLGTRNGRKCDVAIVDEVDSMLIDGKNHIVMLSSPMPAMDHLEPLLAAIWIQIGELAKCIEDINGISYYVDQPDIFNEDGTKKSDLIEHLSPINGTKEDFIKTCTEKHIRKVIRDIEHLPDEEDKKIPEKYPEIKIPKHLRQLVVESQLTKWIDSAIYAKYRCKNEQHYILRDGKIAPVDASNTGIVQANMHWNDGLHQFLQMKHGAKISAESLTTNFLSNVTYFRRYGSNIYGLTGTLGSENAQKLLSNIYNVDNVIIPPFKKKQYQELTPIIVNNENDWYENIVQSSINKLNNGRGVLIISKYIEEVNEIKNRLIKAGYDEARIKTYKTEDESKTVEEEMTPGKIIIATNIAGRGTDIRANKIEINGGLHVLVTFLPPNERVEQQNVGRTSRTGNKGSGQFILLQKNEDNYLKLKEIRNREEEIGIHTAEKEIEKVTIKDAIFEEFCKLLTEIGGNVTLKNNPEHKIQIRAVEDRFGIWLKLQQATTTKEEMLNTFEIFRQKILSDNEKKRLIQNPYFHVLIGNAHLKDKTNKNNRNAIREFTRAIELDEPFQANAYYNRGYARLAEYGDSYEKYKEEVDKAVEDFKRAKQIINDNFEPMLHVIQQASNSAALSEQVSHKMTLYGIQKNTIEMTIGQDIKSQIKVLEKEKQEQKDATERRRTEIENQLKELKKQINEDQRELIEKQINELRNEEKEQLGRMVNREKAINEQIKNLQDNQEAKELGILGQAIKHKHDIKIEDMEIEQSLPQGEVIAFYKEEIEEYKNNGFRGSFKVKDIKPIDWKAVIGVAALGMAQLIGGAAIAVFTLGAGTSIGMGLITEGVSDLITAVKDGIINRDFSWVSYVIQKAISLTVSLVCAGLGAIKDAAKTAVAGVRCIGHAMTTTIKAGWKIAAKAIGTSLAKGVAKELVTQLVDYGVSKALMPTIQDEVMKRIEQPIQNALLANARVKKMLELDGVNRNNRYERLIKDQAMELLNSQKQQNALLSITVGIGKGIATQKIAGLSAILTTYEVTQALAELVKFVPDFIEKLNEVIDKIYKEQKIDEQQSRNQHSKVDTQTTDDKKEKNNKEASQNYAANYTPETSSTDIDQSSDVEPQQQVQLERKIKSTDVLCGALATSVSAQMCNIIQKKLITPVTQTGISSVMTKLTSGLDKSLQDEIGNYQAERRIEFFQDRDKNNRIPDEFKTGMYDMEAVEKADEMIDELINGGEAGLPHLGPLSDAIRKPIKVLDENGQLVRIIGADKGGEPIVVEYHKPNEFNSSGHWTLPGGNDSTLGDTGKNNCLFNVVAEQIGRGPDQVSKDPNQLRKDTAVRMEDNKMNLANQAHDIKRLEQYKKDALTMGGAANRETQYSEGGVDKPSIYVKYTLGDKGQVTEIDAIIGYSDLRKGKRVGRGYTNSVKHSVQSTPGYRKRDQVGHIIGDCLGGPSDNKNNFIPQATIANRTQYHQFESVLVEHLKRLHKRGHPSPNAHITGNFSYDDANSSRPTSIKMEAKCSDGMLIGMDIYNE